MAEPKMAEQETNNNPNPQDPSNSNNNPDLDTNDPRVKQLIEKAVSESTSGLVKNRDEILAEKKALSDRVKLLDGLGGEDGIKQLQDMQKRMLEDEDLKLFSQGKREEYNDRIVGRMKSDYDKKLEARDKLVEDLRKEIKGRDEQLDRIIIDGAIRDAAIQSEGFRKSAIDDAVMRGRSIFVRDENGNPVARDANGDLIMGKDGNSALGPPEWMDGMKDVAEHWWESSAGGGATGGRLGTPQNEAKKLKEQYDKLMASGNIQAAVALKNKMHAQQRQQ